MPAYTKDTIARGIIAEGRAKGMDDLGIVCGISCGLVESNLTMLANEDDPPTLQFPHDGLGSDSLSSGVFQQQPGRTWDAQPSWWGTAQCRMDVRCSAGMFFDRLKRLPYGSGAKPPGQYVADVQQPDPRYRGRYDERMAEAWQIYNRLAGAQPAPEVGWAGGDPVWLADVIRAEGVTVHEMDGWLQRGHGDFGQIWGVVCHHTGSFGETPEGIAFHPTLGLASQIYLSRNGEAWMCGVGLASHAGKGSWQGIGSDNANAVTIGIEAANDGGGSGDRPLVHRSVWSDAQYNAYVKIVAAILRRLRHGASHCISHSEWARFGPAGWRQGKWDPGQIDMDIFRADVQRQIDSRTGETDDMAQVPQEQWDRVYRELTQEHESGSIYRNPGEGKVGTWAWFTLSIDKMTHQDFVERLAQLGDPDAIARIIRVAAGQGADTSEWAVDHANEVLQQLPPEILEAWAQRNQPQ